ncbi:hypothetical protein A7P95_06335 [Eikenella longinqua]|uniref:Uncharacterized protein n=2 Tax=Eikenella longinqua TaxID=1795827 RepID=A0A1A9RWK7_9NEIS|nr:hypothetical protein A7P95_06335 [Eikenella longinqua]
MILRSGGASGLDSYFEQALLLTHSKDEKSAKDIYYAIDTDKITDETAHKMLFGITAYFHPTQAKLLQQEIQYITPLARNLFQIIGIEPFQDTGCITLMQQLKANGSVDINKLELDIRPVRFVLCYTEDGCENHQGRTRQTGGTGQTISYADYFGIPIINLKNLDIMNRINQQLI